MQNSSSINLQPAILAVVNPFETDSYNLNHIAETVIGDISDALKISRQEAQLFIDQNSFEDILRILILGECKSCDFDYATLATVFCHITMRES